MSDLAPKSLPGPYDVLAPDGSEVRVLLSLAGGSMAHFTLRPEQVSQAVAHRSVEEIWYVLGGRAEMWRRRGDEERIDRLAPGDCLTIPVGTHFQFRTQGSEPFTAIAITMPPWPGSEEARAVQGRWKTGRGTGS